MDEELDMSAQASEQVGTKLLFENDRVRVWEMRLKPGESSARHVHHNDYLFVTLSPATLTLYPEHGTPETSQAKPSEVEYTEVGTGITHRLTNSGDTEHWEILVELKGGSRASTPQEPETNG
jgi:quercetin dioxygenase-like cupin family protein